MLSNFQKIANPEILIELEAFPRLIGRQLTAFKIIPEPFLI